MLLSSPRIRFLFLGSMLAMTFPQGRAAADVTGPADFGKTTDGTPVEVYTLKNKNGVVAKVMTLGATLTELHVPDKAGKSTDVVLCCHYQLGLCSDPNPADNVASGTCSNGGAPCNGPADCTQSSASLAHDASACTADGGVVVVGGGSVCTPCPPPPPAS